jgi:hypothetical protein
MNDYTFESINARRHYDDTYIVTVEVCVEAPSLIHATNVVLERLIDEVDNVVPMRKGK